MHLLFLSRYLLVAANKTLNKRLLVLDCMAAFLIAQGYVKGCSWNCTTDKHIPGFQQLNCCSLCICEQYPSVIIYIMMSQYSSRNNDTHNISDKTAANNWSYNFQEIPCEFPQFTSCHTSSRQPIKKQQIRIGCHVHMLENVITMHAKDHYISYILIVHNCMQYN